MNNYLMRYLQTNCSTTKTLSHGIALVLKVLCEKFVEEVPLIMAAADMNLEDLKQATLSKVKVLGKNKV